MASNASKAVQSPSVKCRVRVMLDEEIAIGPGKADLLAAIRDTGSISGAGKQLGMSYRRAWLLVDAMNRCFKVPLVETATGGQAGGGARLTVNGEKVLGRYATMMAEIDAVARAHARGLRSLLRDLPVPSKH
jgi:molybdate transport system regulatory protein